MAARSQIAPVLAAVVGAGTPHRRIAAYDGSTAGPADPASRLIVRDPARPALRGHRPERAGPGPGLRVGLSGRRGRHVHHPRDARRATRSAPLSWADRLEVLRRLGPVDPPADCAAPEETRPGLWWGWRHSLVRDSKAISHHYDVSNRFYEWILGPVDGLHVRGVPLRGRLAGSRPRRKRSTWSAASSTCSRVSGCWTSGAGGGRWWCTRPPTTGSGSSG